MHVNRDELALDLPGKWDERRIAGGHDFRKGNREEIIVSLHLTAEGLDVDGSTARMAQAQQAGMTSECKRVGASSAPAPVTSFAGALGSRVVCDEPAVIATFVAAPVEGRVLTYEHYRYDAKEVSPDLDRADDAILATVKVKPRAMVCPPHLFTEAVANGGTCLEAAVLGQAVVDVCARTFESRGWTRDDGVARVIGRQTAKKLTCYRGAR